jgi:hypothetical protein
MGRVVSQLHVSTKIVGVLLFCKVRVLPRAFSVCNCRSLHSYSCSSVTIQMQYVQGPPSRSCRTQGLFVESIAGLYRGTKFRFIYCDIDWNMIASYWGPPYLALLQSLPAYALYPFHSQRQYPSRIDHVIQIQLPK